jgi:peroxiredoxin
MKIIVLVCALIAFCTEAHAQQRTFERLPFVVSAGGDTVDLLTASDAAPIIVVRHLGATCSHCVEQVRALLRYHTVSGPLPCMVYAISSDDVPTCDTMTRKLAIDTTALRLCSDADDACANALGCVISEKDGTITDLHLVMILHRRRVLFEHYSITPLMSFGDVMQVASSAKR